MNILISGGASGLGESITRKISEDPANNIYFTYYHSAEAAKKLEAEFSNSEAISCNFYNEKDVGALINRMDDMDLDILINNAICSLSQTHFHKQMPDIFRESFNVNVQPTLIITQKAISIFKKKKFGKIITILTSFLLKPPLGMSEYVANKAYLASMSKSWAIEYARFNITSNCISPSIMKTGLTQDIDDRVFEDQISKHPLRKLLVPDEVALEVLALINSSQQINGTNRIINAADNVI